MSPIKPTLLIVEDNDSLRAALKLSFTALGFHVTSAPDGPACLRAVSAARPDLVLLDIMLPSIDGWEVKRLLGEDPATADIPVIAMTALGAREHVARAQQLGFAAYVVKPMTLTELTDAVGAVLGVGVPAAHPFCD